MVTCADASFLFSFYGNDAHTWRAVTGMRRQCTPRLVTILNAASKPRGFQHPEVDPMPEIIRVIDVVP